MGTFIFRFPGDDPPADDLERIRKHPGLKILDETPRMLLVDAPKSAVAPLQERLASWIITPEGATPRPRTRHEVKKRPDDD
jgi:hypothetical protein